MRLLYFLRPKFRHPDPTVRLAAIATVKDQGLLAEVIARDENPDVVRAALGRLTDPELRARIAVTEHPLAAEALAGITDPRNLVLVAEQAVVVAVRFAALERIEDPLALQRIAAQDPDPAVRRRARSKFSGPDRLREFLCARLERMPVSAPIEAAANETTGTVDEVFRALASDSRFQIDGVMESDPLSETPAVNGAEAASRGSALERLELLARPCVEPSQALAAGQMVQYRISLRRGDPQVYHWSVVEQRTAMARDASMWASSSRGA
jgi:hypothetical protein